RRSANCRCIHHRRRWKDNEIYLANDSEPSPAKFRVRKSHCECPRPICKARHVFPAVRERRPIILLAGLQNHLNFADLAGVSRATLRTPLPTAHAMEESDWPMKLPSPWHANATV